MKNIKFWQEFSISRRLAGSFGIAALFTLLASGLGIFTFIQSTQALKTITTDYLPYLSSAHELAVRSRAISAKALALINSRNQSTRRSVVDQINDEFRLMAELIEELTPSGIDSLNTILITNKNLRDGFQQLNALVEQQIVRKKRSAKVYRSLIRSAKKRDEYFNSLVNIDADQPSSVKKIDLLTRSLSNLMFATSSLTKIAQLTYFENDVKQHFLEISLLINEPSAVELKKNISSFLSSWESLAMGDNNIFTLRKAMIEGMRNISVKTKIYARDAKWLAAAAHAVIGEVRSNINKFSEKIDSQLERNGIGLIAIAFLCVVSAIFLAIRIGSNIGMRIEMLQHSMELHAQGEQGEVPLEGSDEIGRMAKALRVFIDKIKLRESELHNTHQELYVNISKLEGAQTALLFSEQRFKDFARVSADWFWEMDSNLRFILVQGSTLESVGISPKKLFNHSLDEILPEQNYTAIEKYLLDKIAFENVDLSWPNAQGEVVYFHVSGKPLFSESGDFEGFRGTGSDVTQAHELSKKLFYQANHDSLTGLVNRNAFERHLQSVLDSGERNTVDNIIFYLDLDKFKIINDTCGHLAGDDLLRNVSVILKDNVRKYDTVARLGGDEFAIVLEKCSKKQAKTIANKLLKAISDFCFIWEGQEFHIGVSIGVVLFSHLPNDITEVLKVADAACYAAKNAGRNCVHVHK
ncbi:MAG: diguanylate cyclase (GGDEF)-like protein/PAS domain S-box-containing protein [Candidatus Endobugula sp.]|jgi:diguanylate cyclase (GGDEF)-like protein/PAS domain S-box-containing protein